MWPDKKKLEGKDMAEKQKIMQEHMEEYKKEMQKMGAD